MSKLHFLVFILFSYQVFGQPTRTEFQVLNADGLNYKTYIKIQNENTTSYTSYYFKSRSIFNITIIESEEKLNFKRYIFEYSYIEDDSQITKANMAENPFFVVLIKNITLYQTRKGRFEFSIMVPLCNDVRKQQDLHS